MRQLTKATALSPAPGDWAPRTAQLLQHELARKFLWLLIGTIALLVLVLADFGETRSSSLREKRPMEMPCIDCDVGPCADMRELELLAELAANETSAPTPALATLLSLYSKNLPLSLLPSCSAAARAAVALPASCGGGFLTLLRAYGAWHASKLALLRSARGNITLARKLQEASGDDDPPISLAVYGPIGGGLGDRLPSIVALFAFALRYRRVFLLDWPPAYGLLASPWLDWRINGTSMPLLSHFLAGTRLEVRWGGDDGHGVWDSPDPETVSPADLPISPYMVTNRGIWSYTSDAAHMAFFDELTNSTPACLHHVLLRPTREILVDPAVRTVEARFSAERAAGRLVYGLHFRAGDAFMAWQKGASEKAGILPTETPFPSIVASELATVLASVASHLMGVSSSASKANGTTLFFLTDFARTREEVRVQYKSAIFSELTPKHIGVDAPDGVAADLTAATEELRTTLVDWWLLAQVDAQLGQLSSGFGRAALLASMNGVFYSAEDCSPCCGAREHYCHAGLGEHFLRNIGVNSGVRLV